MSTDPVATLRTVVLDCPEPATLARFYAGLLGGEILDEDDDPTWRVLVAPGGRRIAFQHAPEYTPPVFPDPKASQQLHLDLLVDDVEAAEVVAVELGAVLIEPHDDERFRVYRDPVGHTFCFVWL
ncbi:VOC family protein [Nocardia harenae]|uniref:VOC family protein n=1 Tax=Nocardia harenae TaxID=358707 RepID=UPI00082CD135|nr:VOC family protein [Nocardia harenae]